MCAVERPRRLDASVIMPPAPDVDLGALAREAVTCRRRMADLGADYADGLIDRRTMIAGTERLRLRLDDLERRQAAAGQSNILGELALLADVESAWNELSVSE